MKLAINLATRPFVELRPFFARLRWIMGGLVLLAVALLVFAHLQQGKLDRQRAEMDALRQRTINAQREKQNNERRMLQPANAEVLDRAHFLNALFLRKSFSWTAVMMDLERVLPTGVQVTAIEPQVTADGGVTIRLRVSGERDRAVQLVRNLEHSARFIHPRLSAETAQSKQNTGTGGSAASAAASAATVNDVEFDILADYNPLPEPAATYRAASAMPAHTVAADEPAAAAVLPTTHHARTPRAGTSGRGDGVVLKPYTPPAGGAR